MQCCCGKGEQDISVKDPNIDVTKLQPILEKHGKTEGSLISILQEAQDLYGYLPLDLLNYIAHKTGLKPANVLGVATFYSQFRLEPIGKNLIMLCQGTACHVNGSKGIEDAICNELNIQEGETTEDGLFTLNNVACLGCCSLSPVMMINGETFGNLTPDATRKILRDIRNKENASKEV